VSSITDLLQNFPIARVLAACIYARVRGWNTTLYQRADTVLSQENAVQEITIQTTIS